MNTKTLLLISMLFIISASCKNPKTPFETESFEAIAMEQISDSEYRELKNKIVERFDFLEYNGIDYFKERPDYLNYVLHPVICVNSKKNRVLGLVFIKFKNGYNTYTKYYGFQFENEWYFLVGLGQYTVTNEYFNYPDSVVVPDEEFFELGNEVLYEYLKKNENDNWVINDAWFLENLQNSGFYNMKDSLTRQEYKEAPDEFWEQKYYNMYLRIQKRLEEAKLKE